MKKIGSMFSLCLAMVVFLTSCGFSNPEDKVDIFIENLNAMDVDGMFDCFEPRKAKQYRSVYNVGSGIAKFFTGMDIDFKSLAQIFPLFSGIDLGDGNSVEWPNWKVKDYSTTIDDDTAEVYAKIVVITGNDEERYDAYFEMVKIDGEWYISSLK